MSEELLGKIENMLHEEKWTRTALSAYTVNLIKELDVILNQVFSAGLQNEVKALCEEHLIESKNSIIALYIAGMVSLEKQLLDDTNLVKLINLFSQNIKWQVVEHICLQMLNYGENKFALRTLVDCYRSDSQDAKLLEAEERLVKVDIEEADIVFVLAQKFEKEKDIERALDYYKKGIHRFIHKKNFNRVREIWLKLIEFCPQESDYFHQVETKVAKLFGADKAAQLLEDLYPLYLKNKNWDEAITVQLRINDYEPKSALVRKEIVDCVKKKYADNPKTEEYIRQSNLGDSWKNIGDALVDFQKQMAYEKGNFVFHKAWGVGRIREVRGQDYIIDFETRRDQTMGHKMAIEALQSLAKDDIRVMIATKKRTDISKQIKSDPEGSLKIILKSFGNKADMKIIKSILVPKVLEDKEWTSWCSAARVVIREKSDFTLSPDRQDEFMLRTQPISTEEKIYNRFKAEKDFFKRGDILEQFLEKASHESDYLMEMFAFFTNYLKSNKINEEVIGSFLIIQKYSKAFPFINPGLGKGFKDYFEQIEDVETLFNNLNSSKLRASFLAQIKAYIPEWYLIFTKLYPHCLTQSILEDLISSGYADIVSKLFDDILEKHKENKEGVYKIAELSLAKSVPGLTVSIPHEKLFITLIHDLDISFRDISNKKDVTDSKRINKLLNQFLFKEDYLNQYIDEASQESVQRIFSLIQDVRDLNPNIKVELKQKIQKRFPTFHFTGEEKPVKAFTRKGMLATLKMFNAKKKELQNIIDVEVPKNSKEISIAMAMGDLKENAEYQAAKEHQTILSANVATLNKELDTATVIEKNEVDASKIAFGTLVTLENHVDGTEEVYTILGPWESNPSKNVISYLSPFGDKLLGAKQNDNIKFTINERHCDYLVKKIEVADF